MSAPSTVELQTTDNGLFEGLFVRALDVSGPLEDELRRLGYDRRKPQPSYPTELFVACIDAARRARHPKLLRDDGLRALGGQFFGGFRQTILGKVFIGAMGVVGPRRLLARIPRQLLSARRGISCRHVEHAPTKHDPSSKIRRRSARSSPARCRRCSPRRAPRGSW